MKKSILYSPMVHGKQLNSNFRVLGRKTSSSDKTREAGNGGQRKPYRPIS